MTYSERFAAEIDAFLQETGMSATAFGREALNDPSFVGDLKKGRKPNLGLVDRVHAFMGIQRQQRAAVSEERTQ